MSTTFNFEELDEATHDYLVAVRTRDGRGAPGVFVASKDSLPGCGLIAGPIIIIGTLLATLTTMFDIVYSDPVRVAVLQTAGLLLGGWLLAAGFRGCKGNRRIAGTWAYVDPLFLYQAYREQITVTAIDEVIEANFTHNYNNNAYQNSTVLIRMSGHQVATVSVANEGRAERMVVFLNYLAWARGPEGGARADLAPATLGGLARYVAKNDHEPLDADNNINFNLIEVDITAVPEEPTRAGRALPSVLPYVFMLVYSVACFLFMAYVINPPFRDDAVYEVVTREPYVEPRFLRVYLVDPRNTRHRDEVTRRLSQFYQAPIDYVSRNAKDPVLRDGMVKILESIRTVDQPVVSIRVTEVNTPAGRGANKTDREHKLRADFATGVGDEFSKQPWGQPLRPPQGAEFTEPMPPLGQQMIAFVEPPEGAEQVHFDITYTIEPAGTDGMLRLSVVMEIRTSIEDKKPTARSEFTMSNTFDAESLDAQVALLKRDLLTRTVGVVNANPPPGFVLPGAKF
ncbi:hypothetical protein [Frigoriglobus tundricola]|uniref:Uncharacterized protein n=1 Tax=Frigoriglobus tundricola TaxID=2774151 RepID=A0A6M5Z6C5_9BACT|nr:hypothetical protein [Frigoriglobus tundricola]QJX00964.1 hypothetical protein FTUN_8602 [Frigoriglobus tundricola]